MHGWVCGLGSHAQTRAWSVGGKGSLGVPAKLTTNPSDSQTVFEHSEGPYPRFQAVVSLARVGGKPLVLVGPTMLTKGPALASKALLRGGVYLARRECGGGEAD